MVFQGTWSGIIGDLQSERADLSVALSVIHGRLEAVDYTYQYYDDPLCFVTAKKSSYISTWQFLKPFSGKNVGAFLRNLSTTQNTVFIIGNSLNTIGYRY